MCRGIPLGSLPLETFQFSIFGGRLLYQQISKLVPCLRHVILPLFRVQFLNLQCLFQKYLFIQSYTYFLWLVHFVIRKKCRWRLYIVDEYHCLGDLILGCFICQTSCFLTKASSNTVCKVIVGHSWDCSRLNIILP
jgi:hypothetical protein